MNSLCNEAAQRTAQLELLLEEKEATLSTTREVATSLQQTLDMSQQELQTLRGKTSNSERNASAAAMLKAEQEAVCNELREKLKRSQADKDELRVQVASLNQRLGISSATGERITELEQKVKHLQTELTEKTTLVTRLRTEGQSAERNHAMRTAMLATAESQLEILRAEIGSKETLYREVSKQLKLAEERMEGLRSQLVTAEKEISRLHSETTRSAELASAQLLERELALRAEAEANALVNGKEYARKSNAARALLTKKEEEANLLSAKVSSLTEEIASGAPNERRIFELAQSQARREAEQGSHRDSREIAFRKLTACLEARDSALAALEAKQTVLLKELTELRRTNKREGVNMAYLKNVVLQFITFPLGSPERLALVPVVAMLLQFTPSELKAADSAARSPTWDSLPIRDIGVGSSSSKGSVKRISGGPYKPPHDITTGFDGASSTISPSAMNNSSAGLSKKMLASTKRPTFAPISPKVSARAQPSEASVPQGPNEETNSTQQPLEAAL